ncbi:MAG: ferredoxin/flavodoxin---NADP+ reductase [Solirubrobacteraceae bacterium]|nr:ferredoxin/flavodoxin---NADP+ reductase [Solirubrobacteraceae bacterium]
MSTRVAVVGAGPSGFYAAEHLLREGFGVDVFDALPTPYGLVRAGVAPDHPKIKSVTRIYEKTAQHPDFRFFGGVEIGADVTRDELLERYHALVYAVGTPRDNRLGIPGEQRPGSVAANRFVAWYNGHPRHAEEAFDLSSSRAVVIGNGNVALDVARMLVLDPDELAPTDTADHALASFAGASVTEVVVIGRRGAAQAAFTTPELRELGALARADIVVDPAEIERAEPAEAPPTVQRNLALLREFAARPPAGRSHRVALRFCRAPVEILGDGELGPVTGVRISLNRLEAGRALPTGEEETISCGLVVRAIGYRGRPLDGVPFDARRGLISNEGGRVCEEDGTVLTGEYAVGWIKRGPSGVIGTNKKCASETVARLLDDRSRGALNEPSVPDGGAIEAWLRERVTGLVTWHGWQAIDAHERGLGAPQGRPRVKLVRLAEMQAVAASMAA